jgi:hypothetical protein
MDVMGITAGEQAGILGLLAGILWLGNIDFNEKADAVSVKNMDGKRSGSTDIFFEIYALGARVLLSPSYWYSPFVF